MSARTTVKSWSSGPNTRLGHYTKVSSKSKNVIVMWKKRIWTFRVHVLPKPSVQSLAARTQDRTYLVDSRASLHMMGLSCYCRCVSAMEPILTLRGVRRVYDEVEGGKEELEEGR